MSATTDLGAFAAFETVGWDARASDYRQHFAAVTGRLGPALLDAAGVHAGTRLLDLGCGPGHIAGQALERTDSVTGCDVSPAMVAMASAAYPAARFDVADATDLPYSSASFDAVIANALFLHLAWPETAAREAAQVLAGTGRLAITVYAEPARARLVGVFLEAVGAVGPRPAPAMPPGPDMFRFASDAELTALLHDAGLVDVKITEIAFDQHLPSSEALWLALANGTVRAAALLEAQPPEVLREIRRAFDERLRPYERDDGLMVPAVFKLATATKPEVPA